ncbi:MAG: hypothetical protein IT435_10120 [Phycisphaerales bacterium]|nr:hypothetical protein [Phycisphaerales bacterium]
MQCDDHLGFFQWPSARQSDTSAHTRMVNSLMVTELDTPSLFESVLADPGAEGELSRSQILDHILAINPTASWLLAETFDRRMLWNYLQHLLTAQQPRGSAMPWIRPADSPGILAREPID